MNLEAAATIHALHIIKQTRIQQIINMPTHLLLPDSKLMILYWYILQVGRIELTDHQQISCKFSCSKIRIDPFSYAYRSFRDFKKARFITNYKSFRWYTLVCF